MLNEQAGRSYFLGRKLDIRVTRLGDASHEVDVQGTDAELGPLQRVAARRQAMCSSMPKGLVRQIASAEIKSCNLAGLVTPDSQAR